MRVLIDYRPALKERTGVGENVHQFVDRRVPHKLLNFARHRLGWPPAIERAIDRRCESA